MSTKKKHSDSECTASEIAEYQTYGHSILKDLEEKLNELRVSPPENVSPEDIILLVEKLTEIISIIRGEVEKSTGIDDALRLGTMRNLITSNFLRSLDLEIN